MAIVPMKRVEIAAAQTDKFALLKHLQQVGVTDIVENPSLAEEIRERALTPEAQVITYRFDDITNLVDLIYLINKPDEAQHLFLGAGSLNWSRDLLQEINRWQQRIELAIKTLRPYDETPKPLFSHLRVRTAAERDETFVKQETLLDTVTQIERIQGDRRPAEERLAGMKTHLNTLEPLKEIKLPDRIAAGRLRTTSGFFRNEAEYENLLLAAEGAGAALAGEIYYKTDTNLIALLAWPFSQDEQIRRVMSESVMQSFPSASEAERAGNFREAYLELRGRIEQTEAEIRALDEELKKHASVIRDLEELSDIYLSTAAVLEAKNKVSESQTLFFLSAYVPAPIEAEFAKTIREKFRVYLQFTDPMQDDEQVPTYLANQPAVSPIESILTTFSPPNYYADVDPSPIMAFTYAFFFGSMLSDIGYGALLLIGCLLGIYKFKAEGNMRRMLWVFASGAAVAIVFGILYGGLFGNMLPAVTNNRVALPVIWFDPMNEPITLMIWSMVFGAVHLFIAIGIDIYNKIRLGDWYEAVFSVAPWYLIIGGIGLMVLGVPYAQWVSIGGAAIILLMSSNAKNPFKRIISGLLGLYSVTSWLSDLLSYTRILALTLATSVIAMVVNMMAAMIGTGGLKVIFLVLVLLVGHALNIALSTLSAYVHASRLHYVEFLGRFYSGGGRLFAPLNLTGRYTNVKEPQDLSAKLYQASLKQRRRP